MSDNQGNLINRAFEKIDIANKLIKQRDSFMLRFRPQQKEALEFQIANKFIEISRDLKSIVNSKGGDPYWNAKLKNQYTALYRIIVDGQHQSLLNRIKVMEKNQNPNRGGSMKKTSVKNKVVKNESKIKMVKPNGKNQKKVSKSISSSV